MQIERWRDFTGVCRTIKPMLAPKPRLNMGKVIDWAETHYGQNSGIPQDEIQYVRTFLANIRTKLPGEWQPAFNALDVFLFLLNTSPDPHLFTSKPGCKFWDYFWYNGSCHSDPESVPCHDHRSKNVCKAAGCHWWDGTCHDNPKPLECTDHTGQNACLAAGCYWYNGSCHSDPKPPPPPPPPECHEHTARHTCLNHGCYWYKGACHADPEPPPPPPPTCDDYKTELKCLSEGCYWWGNACHSEPEVVIPGVTDPLREMAKQVEEYCSTIPLWKPIELVNCGILAAVLYIMSDVMKFQKGRQ